MRRNPTDHKNRCFCVFERRCCLGWHFNGIFASKIELPIEAVHMFLLLQRFVLGGEVFLEREVFLVFVRQFSFLQIWNHLGPDYIGNNTHTQKAYIKTGPPFGGFYTHTSWGPDKIEMDETHKQK